MRKKIPQAVLVDVELIDYPRERAKKTIVPTECRTRRQCGQGDPEWLAQNQQKIAQLAKMFLHASSISVTGGTFCVLFGKSTRRFFSEAKTFCHCGHLFPFSWRRPGRKKSFPNLALARLELLLAHTCTVLIHDGLREVHILLLLHKSSKQNSLPKTGHFQLNCERRSDSMTAGRPL